jgi:outer membrane protein assembly factor BamC
MGLKFILIAVGTMAMVACSSDGDVRRQEYLDADYYTRLELPPNLTEPSATQQLSVPKPTDAELEKFKTETRNLGKLDGDGKSLAAAPLLPALKGVELKSVAGLSWLEVAGSPPQLWPKLAAFWNLEGIPVVQSEPLFGIIETDWVNKLQVKTDASWYKRIFSHVEPDRLDKFRMRIEPASVAKTRVYVSHSGMELVVQDENVSWRARCSEAGLEQDVLSRLALYIGLDPAQAKTALLNYKPYASRVKIPAEEKSALLLSDSMDNAWLRSRHALDRLGADIQESDASQHQFKIALPQLKREVLGEERDEIAESSWLMQWLTSSDEDDKDRQFRLVLAPEKNGVRLSILNLAGEPAESVLAEQFRKALARELQ